MSTQRSAIREPVQKCPPSDSDTAKRCSAQATAWPPTIRGVGTVSARDDGNVRLKQSTGGPASTTTVGTGLGGGSGPMGGTWVVQHVPAATEAAATVVPAKATVRRHRGFAGCPPATTTAPFARAAWSAPPLP